MPFALSRGRMVVGIGFVLLVCIGAAVILLQSGMWGGPTPTSQANVEPGHVRYCISTQAPFMVELGFSRSTALDTRARYVQGAMLREFDAQGNIVRSHQDPSWTQAGYLGAYTVDRAANIYLAPMPFISLLENPPEKANIIQKIDAETGIMAPLVDLPAAAPLTPQSVYGLTDLIYDCDTGMLYASSVMGSTYDRIAGRVFQVDPATGEILSMLEGIDAFSLDIFNTSYGKRLYIGSARVPEIYAIALDATGGFTGELSTALTLYNLGYHQDERPRSLTFQGTDRLIVNMLQFDFNLVAATESRQTVLEYGYLAEDDTWALLNSFITTE